MKLTAKAISVLFHPLFMIGYMLIILLVTNPYMFSLQDEKAQFLLLFSVFILTVFFPLFSIFMMVKLDLVSSFQMENKTERIGPLVATGTFYLWLYINIKGNSVVPPAFSFFVLGATIALFLSLLLNSFTKISLHTVGMGGMLAGTMFMRYFYTYDQFFLKVFGGTLAISTNLILLTVIVIAGAVGTSRLLLKAHDPMDVYGGYLVGIFAQIVAFRIVMG